MCWINLSLMIFALCNRKQFVSSKKKQLWLEQSLIPSMPVCGSCGAKRGCSHLQMVSCMIYLLQSFVWMHHMIPQDNRVQYKMPSTFQRQGSRGWYQVTKCLMPCQNKETLRAAANGGRYKILKGSFTIFLLIFWRDEMRSHVAQRWGQNKNPKIWDLGRL